MASGERVTSTPESQEEQHVSFEIPSKNFKSSSTRTPSLLSDSSANFTLRTPRYHKLYQPSLREQWAVQLDNSELGSVWKLVDAALNILLCGIYISNTPYFKRELPSYHVWFEFVVTILLLLEYIPKFYIAHFTSWRSLFTHLSPILTFLTVYPVFSVASDSNFKDSPELVFLYPFRFIRCHFSVRDCFVRSEKSVLRLGQVTSKVLIFVESIIFLILTGSALLYGVEFVYKDATLSFLDAVFFTTIMLGTVGYLSDIVPDSAFPRILLLVIFTMGLIFIPYSISELTILLRSKSPYDKAFRKISPQPHVIIITPTIELPSLRHFLKEFYSLAHGPGTINTKVVILNPVDPNERVKTFLSDPMYAHRVQYVRGSSLDSRSLKKVKAKDASAYFILAKKYSQQSESIDAENVLKAMALRKYDEGPKLYIQCILPENKIHFESLNPEQIICIDELKLAILAHSCLTPGFSTLLYGLTTSFTSESVHELRYMKRRTSHGLDQDSIEDYISGLSQCIYTTTLSDFYSGNSFLSVAESMYETLGVVLFAIGIPKQRSYSNYSDEWSGDWGEHYDDQQDFKNYMVLINPGDYIVKGDEIGFIIASDASILDGVRMVGTAQSYRTSHTATNAMSDNSTDSQPLVPVNSFKSGDDYFGIKKKYGSVASRTPDHFEYPHKPESAPSIRRQRALSTPLAFNTENHEHHSEPSGSSSVAATPVLHEGEASVIESISGHILLCDYSQTTFPRNLDCFVSPLRKSYLGKTIPIIILSPARPNQSQWRILSQFQQVYFVQGNPMTREGLECGRVTRAKQAVILTDASRILRNGEKTEDAPAMLVFLNIKAMCDIQVFVEFVYTDNMKFMSEDTAAIDKEMQAHHSPAFMAGTCFSLSMLDSIICQSYYQPHIVSIIHQMLFGAPPLQLPSGTKCPAPAHSHVFQIPMPQAYVGAKYCVLFRDMLVEKKAVPLGLYRTRTARSSSGDLKELKYVYTCPKASVILRDDDMLYVLSKREPVM
ncbi:11032_t:CDS:10 [Ambispora leptoticha]|uniref:11032_t:CDS:1 n=1 Tax=Ambispora leptoticha TaxID=144679 RepID=A0A9N8WS03_9GLOM|nr:11032_t:CDS:10 [Ambispora leptoticha]